MGLFFDRLKAAGTPTKESLPEVWGSQFPILSDAMFPVPGKATGTFLTPRFSVTLFTEGCKLKAVVGAKEGPGKFWMTLDGPESVLEQIELILKSGGGEYRESDK